MVQAVVHNGVYFIHTDSIHRIYIRFESLKQLDVSDFYVLGNDSGNIDYSS